MNGWIAALRSVLAWQLVCKHYGLWNVDDVAGKFLAHVNLGIICNAIGNYEQASINHQFALRYAIQMSSVAGQSVAIGNLGKVGGNQVYA